MLGDEDYEQIDKEIEMDLLHDIEQIVENDQVEDAADAVVDQGLSSKLFFILWKVFYFDLFEVIADSYRDNNEILVGDDTVEKVENVDYDNEDDQLSREIRAAEEHIEALKAKKTTPAPEVETLSGKYLLLLSSYKSFRWARSWVDR